MRNLIKIFLASSTALFAACASTPVQYSEANMSGVAQDLLQTSEAPDGFENTALSLNKAREMAITRNQNYRQRVNRLLVKLDHDKGRTRSMLPEVYAQSFGRWRNNTNASVGVRVDELGAAMPEDFYTAQDQSLANSNITLTWDMLDIALTSHNKAGAAIKGFDAIENNRVGCHQLMVDLERAYWRKAAYDRAKDKREWLNNRIDYALDLSNQEAGKGEDKELPEWMYQRELIDIKRWYESMYRGLASAESDLKKLINIPHRTEFVVETHASLTDGELGSPRGDNLEDLFVYAFENRPEIRRTLYTIDQTQLENEKNILRRLPGLSLFMSGNNDTNSFALNKDFLSAGINLSWDVIGLVNMGRTKQQGKARLGLERDQLDVIATSIMAQVALALENVKNLNAEMDLAWKAKDIQDGITGKLNADVKAGKNREIYLIKEELLREMSILREDIARAELRAGEARLAQSLGTMKTCEI